MTDERDAEFSAKGAETIVTALVYAWLREHGLDSRIPDFTTSYGRISREDKIAFDRCVSIAYSDAAGLIMSDRSGILQRDGLYNLLSPG